MVSKINGPANMKQELLRIINTIRENKAQEPLKELEEGASLRADIGFDSLDLAELTVRVEAEFGVDVFDDGPVETVAETLAKIKDEQKRK